MFVESGAKIFLWQFRVLFISMREVNVSGRQNTRRNLLIRQWSARVSVFIRCRSSDFITFGLAMIEDESVAALGFTEALPPGRIPPFPRPKAQAVREASVRAEYNAPPPFSSVPGTCRRVFVGFINLFLCSAFSTEGRIS